MVGAAERAPCGPSAALALVASACGVTRTGVAMGSVEQDPHTGLRRSVFLELAEPSCTLCHTLPEAGPTGLIGPNLDPLRPKSRATVSAAREGVVVMPAQAEHLTEEEIRAVALDVFEATKAPE